MAAIAEECLELDSAWDGLSRFLRQSIAKQVTNRGLRDAFLGPRHLTRHAQHLHSRLTPPVAALLYRAQQDGTVRRDVSWADLLMLQLMLTKFADGSEQLHPDAYQRFLDLFIDSIRQRRDQAAISDGLTEEDAIRNLQNLTEYRLSPNKP